MSTQDGLYRRILDRGKIVERDAHGTPVRMVGAFSDIKLTPRKNMEDDLRRKEEQYRQLIWKTGIQFAKKLPSIYIECPMITKDGREMWIGQSVRLLLNKDTVTGFHAVARDITERKMTEKALKESEEHLHAVLDNVQAGIILIDPETHAVVNANRTVAQMCNTSIEN